MNDREARCHDMFGRDQTFEKNNDAVGRLVKADMTEVNQVDAIMNNKYARISKTASQPH